MSRKQKTIIFDMDGTLYPLKAGFDKSEIAKLVLANTAAYLADQLKVSARKAQSILDGILRSYGTNSLSIKLEKEFGLNRAAYFTKVWDLPAERFIRPDKELRPLLLKLLPEFQLFLISDAPRIWIDKVLSVLRVRDVFGDGIYSGEGDVRKSTGNAFSKIVEERQIEPALCVSVGDKESADILPAKAVGMKTVYVSRQGKATTEADAMIKDLNGLEQVLKNIFPA